MFQTFQDIGNQIVRIETGMMHREFAACYLLQSKNEFAIIETGSNHTVPIILDYLQQQKINREQVKYVIPTHVHLDHAGGAGGLMQALPYATLLIHPRGARHMIEPEKLKAGVIGVYGEAYFNQMYGDIIPVDGTRVQSMDDQSRATIGQRELVFYDTPGHANHHFCIHDPQSKGIFCGDTFGIAYPSLRSEKGDLIFPTTTPVQFDPDALKASIRRLISLQPDVMYLTHYGPVKNPKALAETLLTQVDFYAENAKRVAKTANNDVLEMEISQCLRSNLFERAVAHGCNLKESEFDELVKLDMQLNSQGLAVWLNKNGLTR